MNIRSLSWGCPWVGHNERNENISGKLIETYMQPIFAQKIIFHEWF
jgi:hypothetical protein